MSMTDLATGTPECAFPRCDVFIDALAEAGIVHVELARAIDSGAEVLGLLVADKDVSPVYDLARRKRGLSVKCFTIGGSLQGSFRIPDTNYSAITLAIFPIDTAEALLSEAGSQAGLSAERRFEIAAYVATYFGGSARLLAVSKEPGAIGDELYALAQAAGLGPGLCESRGQLDAYLAQLDLRPPVDMLERLGLADRWIHEDLVPRLTRNTPDNPGLTCFFLRSRAVELGKLETMRRGIEACGYEVLLSLPLKGALAEQVRKTVRGGNWGSGPWPVNGGPPVHLLFSLDVFPVQPAQETLWQHPFLDNGRTLETKVTVRDLVQKDLPGRDLFNPLHSADNSAETLRFAQHVLDEDTYQVLYSSYLSRCAEVQDLIGDAPALQWDQTRAKSVLVDGPDGPQVRKVYRRQFAHNVPREADLLNRLAPDWPELPAVRSSGAQHLDLAAPPPDAVPLAALGKPVPLEAVLRLRDLLNSVMKLGYDPSGWQPGQWAFLRPKDRHMYVAGFDRLRHEDGPVSLSDAQCFDNPDRPEEDFYAAEWYPVLAVPKRDFTGGSKLRMTVHRTLVYPVRSAMRAVVQARRKGLEKLRLWTWPMRRALRNRR